MRHILNIIFITISAVAFVSLTSCKDHNDEPKDTTPEQMILVYAVNHNNLSGDLRNNEYGMLEAMKQYNPDKCKLLVYKYTSSNPGLYEVVSNGAEREFKLIKEYDKSVLSVTGERVSQVIDDAISLYPDLNKDLFFWGHGTGWVNPSKYSATRVVSGSVSGSGIAPQSFGGEYINDTSTTTEYIDVDELVEAVPDHVFDIIWFDCCYMSTIEVAYQFRNKCNTYVAYPTEIMGAGLPYEKVLPKVIERNPKQGAEELYKYYVQRNEAVTVAVMDMNKIEEVAKTAKSIYALGEERPEVAGMQNYSRFYNAQYYDFGQYMREYIAANVPKEDETIANRKLEELNTALDNFVIFKAASEKDFNKNPIMSENYSGLSCHNYLGLNTEREAFYRKLDWYKASRGN